jgi:phage FluMu protein Com
MAVQMAARPAPAPLRDVRCAGCGTLLLRARGAVDLEVVCTNRQCRRWQRIRLPGEAGRRGG